MPVAHAVPYFVCISSCEENFLALLLSMFYQYGKDDREKNGGHIQMWKKKTRYILHSPSIILKQKIWTS